MRLLGREKGLSHSLPVCHAMRCDETARQKKRAVSHPYNLLIMGCHGDKMRLQGKKKKNHSHTNFHEAA